jgi:hypothetical protein
MDSPNKPKQTPIRSSTSEGRGVNPIVDTFAGRISRRLEEKELAESQSAQASNARYNLIMQALTFIRKALQEACKIRLGDRFSLVTEVNDAEGWPKISLRLLDKLAPEWNELAVETHASDRQENGLILMETKAGEKLLSFSITETDALQRLPIHLKKALRRFLDIIECYVLDPKKPEDMLSMQAKSITKEEKQAPFYNPLSNTDVFENDAPIGSEGPEATLDGPTLTVDIFSPNK